MGDRTRASVGVIYAQMPTEDRIALGQASRIGADTVSSMEPRKVGDIAQLPIRDRDEVIARGLDLLAEHLGQLAQSTALLTGRQDGSRALKILDAVRLEEAAKALILLDIVRNGWRDQRVTVKLFGYFRDHLARGIYGELVAYSPATLGELARLADNLRPSHYLDGPSGSEYLYRNSLEAAREESFYVDYVKFEDGTYQWIGPANSFSMTFHGAQPSTDLVLALHRLGMFNVGALNCIRHAWQDVELSDATHWQENVDRNRAAMVLAHKEGHLNESDSTASDVATVLDRWTFPLASLDLTRIDMTPERIDNQRESISRAFLREMSGE